MADNARLRTSVTGPVSAWPWRVAAGALSRLCAPGTELAAAPDPEAAAEVAWTLATERGEVVHLRAGDGPPGRCRYVVVPPGAPLAVLKRLTADLADAWGVGR